MLYKVHKFFAILSFLTIVVFFTSTIIVELFFSYNQIATVKSLIVCPGLFILIPSIAITAITGNIIAKKSNKVKLIAIKKRRMPIIAVNGIFILIPSAILLNNWASNEMFDYYFYSVQALELIAGGINIIFMFLNIKDSKNIKQ